jgi:trimeric autotransporter adhesin
MAKFTGTAKNDTLTGGTGNDLMFGLAGDDALLGGLGDDILDGGAGADSMFGGQGNDRYFIDTAGDSIAESVNNGRDQVTVRNAAALTKAIDDVEDYTFIGTARVSFTGNAGDNAITSAGASDTLFGEVGNDTLNGGAGADLLEGGDGNDNYVVDNAGDMVRETTADISGGIDLVLSSVSFTLGSGLDRLELIGTAAVNGTGNDLANDLRGNNAANRLSALGGDDRFDGVGGNDTLDGGLGADTMVGGTGNDTYFVDNAGDVVIEEFAGAKGGIDTVFSSVGQSLESNVEHLALVGSEDVSGFGNNLNNRITGNDGGNVLGGLIGNDTVDGGAGDDIIGGGPGNDVLIGDTGSDLYTVDRGDKIVEAVAGPSGGIDTVRLFGSGNSFTLGANLENLELIDAGTGIGNSLDNILSGAKDSVTLLGLAGADTLFGSDSSDTLNGGSSADRMEGGAGNDVYIVDDVGDVVAEGISGGDFDEIRTTLSVFLPVANVERYTFLGGAVNFTADAGNNTIRGTNFNDTLNGGGGGGELRGGAGNDLLIVGGTGGTDIFGGTGADTMIGGSDGTGYNVDNVRDVVDEVTGGDTGDDTVRATISYSLVANGTTLWGTIEDLLLFGGGTLTGTGNDLNNFMLGNDGATRLFGGLGADTLDGNAGNDTLDGGGGDDRLIGGRGNDLLIVNTGNDTVLIQSKLDGRDLIQGFDGDAVGGQDILDLNELFIELGIPESNRVAHVQITDKGSTVEIRVDTSLAGDGVFDYFVATLQTTDDITAGIVGADVVIGT